VKKLRVLVVEDSLTVRQRIQEVLSSDREIEVVGSAEDGKRAIELCTELRPDVISLDMMLPIMTGLTATEYIMAHTPTPILIVSSSVNRGEIFRTYDALAAGAVDVFDKPRGDDSDGDWDRRFLAAIKMAARIRVITHLRGRLGTRGIARREGEPVAFRDGSTRTPRIVALGASTGGPGVLAEILRGLPSPFPIPILIVLHIGEPFGAAFADWLDAQTPHRVIYAQDGEPINGSRGKVWMAPPGRHLIVRGGRLLLTADAERHSCRPSIDVLFESIAREYGSAGAACLLTGMGRDGASGLLDIRNAGGFTIAQDEATSTVYGMPMQAAIIGAAEHIVPVSEIAPALAAIAHAGEVVER
jgi:two-component system chemotaxis response regulator CheB